MVFIIQLSTREIKNLQKKIPEKNGNHIYIILRGKIQLFRFFSIDLVDSDFDIFFLNFFKHFFRELE